MNSTSLLWQPVNLYSHKISILIYLNIKIKHCHVSRRAYWFLGKSNKVFLFGSIPKTSFKENYNLLKFIDSIKTLPFSENCSPLFIIKKIVDFVSICHILLNIALFANIMLLWSNILIDFHFLKQYTKKEVD